MCARPSRPRHSDVRAPQRERGILGDLRGMRLAPAAVMRFVYVLAYVASLVAATGCARAWPEVGGIADATFLHSGGVRSVAIVPVDVTLGVGDSVNEAPDAIGARFEIAAAGAMQTELLRRGYVPAPDEAGADAVLSLAGFAYAGRNDDGAKTALAVLGII